MDKAFIITIDTEGDNLWSVKDIKQDITTENAKYLFRFQELCEKFSFVPTYLTNYEMACSEAMKELGLEGLKKKTLEIGAHEHAWNQPPYYPLIKRPGRRGKPYLAEYPRQIIRKKLEYLTGQLQDTFQCPITSHRGGRWCLDQTITDELSRLGYLVDCTCTPGVSWKDDPGWTWFSEGTDWEKYECNPFYLRTTQKDGKKSEILEVPVSIIDIRETGHFSWLRPMLTNRREMISLIDRLSKGGEDYAEFMLHSSELMPGGSPLFNNKGKIEKLYADLEEVFSYAARAGFKGVSLSNYAKDFMGRS